MVACFVVSRDFFFIGALGVPYYAILSENLIASHTLLMITLAPNLPCGGRPDITVMVDWAVKNQLSIYLSLVVGLGN